MQTQNGMFSEQDLKEGGRPGMIRVDALKGEALAVVWFCGLAVNKDSLAGSH